MSLQLPTNLNDNSAPAVSHSTYTPRVVLVTGAARGIGYSIAHRLADDGFDVAVNDIPSKASELDVLVAELQQKGRRALAIPADISLETDVISMIEKAVQELGGLDVMVANAGISAVSSFLESTVQLFDEMYATNARGVFLCYKHAARQMIKQGRAGRLIGATSAAGKQAAPYMSAYSASKFAVRAVTQAASIELRRYGITVNAYAPGGIVTPLSLLSTFLSVLRMYSYVVINKLGRLASVKKPFKLSNRSALPSLPPIRFSFSEVYSLQLCGVPPDIPDAYPDVVASIVSYLAKPEAHFINGQAISVDGGLVLN
ncbi:NAD-binding protein [Phellopilus nigrolimitatus]|nr:NAD-binding protein [Phellopilus nigrolimitatus]